VVVKNLETHVGKVAHVAGATILGDGRVALILDVGALVRRSWH
jgi:two-component system, chemotaxis family, sensor kinase CheA